MTAPTAVELVAGSEVNLVAGAMNENKEGLLGSLTRRLEEEPLRIAEAKKRGRKVVGYFCPHVPEELILAAGMLPVRLAFGGKPEAASAGEGFLGPYTSPYVRSCLGNRLLPDNFFYSAVDAVCVAHTCESMRRVQEYWEKYLDCSAFPLGLTRTHHHWRTRPQAIEYFKHELGLLRRRLGEFGGQEIKDRDIRRAISLCNQIREKLRTLYEYPRDDSSPIEWRQVLQITQAGFLMDRSDFLAELKKLEADLQRKRLEERPDDPRSRLMIVGAAIGIGDDKVLDVIKQADGNVVADCVCTGSMFFRKRVPVFGIVEKPIDSLAERYLYNVTCPFMTDLPRRLNHILKTARDFKVHGLIYYNLKYCDATRAQFKYIKDALYRELLVPTLLIETDYSPSDADTIKARVETFIEMIGGRI